MLGPTDPGFVSPNFAFLTKYDEVLARHTAKVCPHGPPWFISRGSIGASWVVDLMAICMKPLVVEYPEELPGLLKMIEEQFAAEVRFLPPPNSLSWASRVPAKPQLWQGLRG